MPDLFLHVAIDKTGRRVRGVTEAADAKSVFARLKAEGLTPVSVKPGQLAGRGAHSATLANDRDAASLVSDLATLLSAGADIRSALNLVGGPRARPAVRAAAQAMIREISGGQSVDSSLGQQLGPRHAFIAALAAAGEASGDLVGGLRRGADMLQARIRVREQMVSTLAYPMFVMATAVAAFVIILTLVVPSIAPLAEAPGADPGLAMRVLLGASNGLRQYWPALILFLALSVAGVVVGWITGALGAVTDRMFLDGPARRTASNLVYGGFAIALGGILSAGAPASEALRLSLRAVQSGLARRRLEPVVQAVRQGEPVSSALGGVAGFPEEISRLAMIGEESGALGPMLLSSGQIAENTALDRVRAAGQMLGPVLIVLLGALIGLLMAGLLSGVSGLGEASLE